MTDFAARRAEMVEMQLRRRGVADERVLQAMGVVPRELFLPPELAASAYVDEAVRIAEGQPISQPQMVAIMLQAALLSPEDRVLDIGTGSGYAAALLGRLVARVFTIERRNTLYDWACDRLREADARNVETRLGDGMAGWPEAAPFDAILVAAAATRVLPALQAQLAVGGRLVMPVGESGRMQCLVRITREAPATFRREDVTAAVFVPLAPGVVTGADAG